MSTGEIVKACKKHGFDAEATPDGRIIVSLATRRPTRSEVQLALAQEGIAVTDRFIVVRKPAI